MESTVLGKLSIGYNRSGQKFFDLLNKYAPFIHSYYFNPMRMFDEYYNPVEFYEEFKDLYTYGIEGNLMFNSLDMLEHLKAGDIVRMAHKYISHKNLNITSATVVRQSTVELLKYVKPDIKIHLSVRNSFNSVKEFAKHFNPKDIYCVNLSSNNVFNTKLMDDFHHIGIKTKTIANLWCMYGREQINAMFNTIICSAPIAGCKLICVKKLNDEYSWLNLTRQGYTKEFMPFFDHHLDIIKLSTRDSSLDTIKSLLNLWTNNDQSTFFNCRFKDGITKDFIKLRMKCNNKCLRCKKCKKIFDKYNVERLEDGYVA